jgi:hypothetical protein
MPEDVPNQSVEGGPGRVLGRLSTYVARGLRYWEPRRVIYNSVLLLVVVAHFIAGWPKSGAKASFDLVLGLFILAVLANLAYCAAYVGDLFFQVSGLEAACRWGRIALLLVGTLFGATLAHFIASGIFAG